MKSFDFRDSGEPLARFMSLSSQAQHGYAIGDPDTTQVQQ
jgi:hypothetical protein